jgi:hypothetical protein
MPGDSRDGPIDRLAKALFASPSSPLTAFADRQRLERLEQCKQLEDILLACQKANEVRENDNRGSSTTAAETGSAASKSRSEARIKRFFKWNESQETNGSNDANNTSSNVFSDATASIYGDGGEESSEDKQVRNRLNTNTSPRYSKDCIKETHEMWACRALALGCGNHLSNLKQCWSDASSVQQNTGEITFKDGDSASDASCRGIQQQMARCVTKNAVELEQRMASTKQ